MKASWVVLLTGLCFGALAVELGKEEGCTSEAENSTVNGVVMLQKAPGAVAKHPPVPEDEKNKADEASELTDSEAPGPIDCGKFTKQELQAKIDKITSRITRIKALPLECVSTLAMFKRVKTHVLSCTSPYGSFIQDGVSEEVDIERQMPSWVPTCQKMTPSAAAAIMAYVDKKIPELETKISDGTCLAGRNKMFQRWEDQKNGYMSCL